MSTSQRSYYEIALTNRQVLIAFSILLGCVVSAFVSGLWVGRQAAARTLASTEVSSPGDTTAPGTYRFFGEDATAAGEEPSPPQAVGKGQTSATPARTPQPEGTQPTPTESVVARPARRQPPAETPDVAKGMEPEAAAAPRTASPSPREEPTRQAAAVPETPAAAPSSAPSSEGQEEAPEPERRHVVDPPATSELSVIQVFSTADEAQARAVLDRLKSGGFRAFLSPVQVDGRTMYRVRVGPFRERAAAEAEAAKLKQLYKLDTWITN